MKIETLLALRRSHKRARRKLEREIISAAFSEAGSIYQRGPAYGRKCARLHEDDHLWVAWMGRAQERLDRLALMEREAEDQLS
jgi:hypothetical protein